MDICLSDVIGTVITVILPFKHRFVEPILAGWKIHSIRLDKARRWKSGRTIHYATGVRTKNYRCFNMDTCRSVQSFELQLHPEIVILIDSRELELNKYELLAHNDGFSSLVDMLTFFKTDFKGVLIHWTDFRY